MSSSHSHHHRKHRSHSSRSGSSSSLRKESLSFDASLGSEPVKVVHRGERTHKKVRKHKAKKSNVRKLESFITKYLFLALGIIFLTGSIWWMYDNSTVNGGSFWNTIMTFLFPVNKAEIEHTEISNPFEWSIYIPYILGFVLLAISAFIKNIKTSLSITLATIAIIYLNLIHLKILYYDGLYTTLFCYPNHNTSLFISLFLLMLTIAISFYLSKPNLIKIAVPSFYASLFLIIGYFGLKIYLLMPSLLLVTVLIYVVSVKQNTKNLNLWNFIFAWFFIFMIWMRKIVALITPDYLFSFILFSTLFYICNQLFFIVTQISNSNKKDNIFKIVLLSINTLLAIVFNIFALNKFGYAIYSSIYSFGIILFNILTIYYIIRNKLKIKLAYFYYSTIVLIGFAIALVFNANYPIIILAISSLLLLVYSKQSRDQIAILISLGLSAIMFLIFFLKWVFVYLPASFTGTIIVDKQMFFYGLVSGIFVVPILFVNNQILKKLYISFSTEWFKRDTIRLYQRLFFIFSLYLLLFYSYQYIILTTFKSNVLSGLSWYVYNCIFLIILIYLAGRKVRTVYILSILIATAFSVLCYPLFIHYYIREIRDVFTTNQSLFVSGFGMHYVAVFLTIYLFYVINHRIKRKFSGNKLIFRIYYIYTTVLSIFFLLSEYDHISFIQAYRKGILTQSLAHDNSHLPYSVLLIISSIVIITIAFTKRFRFVRFIGIAVLSIALIKILLFDFEVLSGNSKVVVSFLLGAILILFSKYFDRIKKFVIHKGIKG